MLEIKVLGKELYNQDTCEFTNVPTTILRLEHSLVSISKWESRWEKSFFGDGGKENPMTAEEFRDYVYCMTLNTNVDANL